MLALCFVAFVEGVHIVTVIVLLVIEDKEEAIGENEYYCKI